MAENSMTTTLNRLYWPIVIILLLITILLFIPKDQVQPNNVGTYASDLAEFGGSAITDRCVDHEGIGMNYHFNLFIYINESKISIPANIGISSDCMHALHTHDDSGHIHIELGKKYTGNTPTLHDFFKVWGYEFNSTSLLNKTGTVSMNINEQSISSSTLSQGYRMADGDVIVLKIS